MSEDESGVTIGYMDLTDFECELGVALGGNVVYSSPDEVLSHRKCATVCGIVEVEVRFRRIVLEPTDEFSDTSGKIDSESDV